VKNQNKSTTYSLWKWTSQWGKATLCRNSWSFFAEQYPLSARRRLPVGSATWSRQAAIHWPSCTLADVVCTATTRPVSSEAK
jgi:hypothetical protein